MPAWLPCYGTPEQSSSVRTWLELHADDTPGVRWRGWWWFWWFVSPSVGSPTTSVASWNAGNLSQCRPLATTSASSVGWWATPTAASTPSSTRVSARISARITTRLAHAAVWGRRKETARLNSSAVTSSTQTEQRPLSVSRHETPPTLLACQQWEVGNLSRVQEDGYPSPWRSLKDWPDNYEPNLRWSWWRMLNSLDATLTWSSMLNQSGSQTFWEDNPSRHPTVSRRSQNVLRPL